jgi:site-specific DNA-methyltransferase (adenine-specific)
VTCAVELPTDADPVRVIEGDCLDVLRVLPDGAADCVLTDPPYGTGGYTRKSAGGGKTTSAKRVRHEWDRWSVEWLTNAARVGSRRAAVFAPDSQVSSASDALAELCGPVRLLVWCKLDPMPTHDGRIGYGTEFIAAAGGLEPIGGGNWFTASTPRANRDREHAGHPYQKPLALMRWLVRAVCPPGGVILDPFAGSGTTGVAAMMEGRRAILIEREPAYADIARRRIEAAARPGLFANVGDA